ncbi:protein CD300H isoform X1 [Sapajus apella]|uniref:Protein CD300H isoform X1 n=1 Tax=Sapajus apella TaxID=9515 RepID=A0A6J3ESG6_SAPAP|nr:protein CD300H isoform X1 [Sapajus apella]
MQTCFTRKSFSQFSALFSPDHTVPCVPGFLHTLTSSENQTQKRLEKETSGVWNSKEGTGELTLCDWAPASDPAATRDFRAGEMTQRAGAPGLPSALLLLCVPGCLTVSGPSTVMGTVGSSLSVQCRYEEKYKMFNKYWCRQPCLPFWHETVETTGSETVVRSDRVIITDHPGDRTFTVTLENLTAEDAGKYRCGIATILQEDGLSGLLPEPFFQVQVLVSSTSTTGSGTENSVKTSGSPTGPGQCQGSSSVYFLLLLLLKVPLLLSTLGAILWVSRPWRTPWTEPWTGELIIPCDRWYPAWRHNPSDYRKDF